MPVYQLTNDLLFPDPAKANPDGLLAVGGDLTPDRLILAYSNGIFPWYSDDNPILWWSPDPRLVLFPDNLKVSNSLRQIIKQEKFEIRFDADFPGVIRNCAIVNRKDQDSTWITEDMVKAYIDLHELGYAHSVEAYFENELVGGLYGISLGKAFFGESMFYFKNDASKVALFNLAGKLKQWKFNFIDAQVKTSHMISMGAKEIRRKEYLDLLESSLKYETRRGRWTDKLL